MWQKLYQGKLIEHIDLLNDKGLFTESIYLAEIVSKLQYP